MSEITLTEANFKSEVLDHKGVVLVDFWAAWCGPCRMMGPIFADAAASDSATKWGKLNVDEAQAIAQEYGVMSIPTIIVFRDGKKVDQMVGVQDKTVLLGKAKEHRA